MATNDKQSNTASNASKPSSNYRQPVLNLRPNTQTLTAEERTKAQMIRAGRTAYRRGVAAAQAEMDVGALRGWTIDTELSSPEGLVVTKGREIRVAYRGGSRACARGRRASESGGTRVPTTPPRQYLIYTLINSSIHIVSDPTHTVHPSITE